ncbi:hypothetical protein TCAL_08591, partial [Tigriopus californicus]
ICIENLITAPLKSEDEIESNKKCKLDVSTAPCGHVFHTACLSQWVHHHHHCPQCRHPTSVTSMIKLYLSEEQEVKTPRGGLNSKLVEGAASLEQTTQGEYHTEAEDHKVIQDVLQCQLEDLESHLQRARKSLNLMEDQLQERVIELSALEIKLIRGQDREESLHQTIHQRDARIRELELKETTIKNNWDEEKKNLGSQCALLTKRNSELLQKIYKFREDERRKDLDLRGQTQNIEYLTVKNAQSESDLQSKNDIIIELQTQLENSHRFESYSVYESVDRDQTQPKGSCWSNCCRCVK